MHTSSSTCSHMPNMWQYLFLSIYTHTDRQAIINTKYKCVTYTVVITVRIQGCLCGLGSRIQGNSLGFWGSRTGCMDGEWLVGFYLDTVGTDKTVGSPRERKSWGLVRSLVLLQCWPTPLRSGAGGRTWLSHAPLHAALCFGPGLKPHQMGQMALSWKRGQKRSWHPFNSLQKENRLFDSSNTHWHCLI